MFESLPVDMQTMKVVDKPWGREIWWAVTPKYVGKVLEVRAGNSLSLQYHKHKMETMYFLKGTGTLLLDEEEILVTPGLCRTIKPGQIHRIVSDTDILLLEVSTPEMEDVVRLSDAYGRGNKDVTNLRW